ncbi:putative OB-fold protein [Constrictibacter sp. MBR-5]|uniref:Zn-ribbon domain-containing OB-fold protein n=1 Tax=Constrictibacter sp. MBR-5 TaxID=3156467 RepID=UPI0033939A01
MTDSAFVGPGPDAEFQSYLEHGKFMIQRVKETGRHVFYPRVLDPETGSPNLEWVEASGLGTVYSTSVVRQRPPAKDYNVALIDLAEGPRMMSRVEGLAPDAVTIGMRVKAKIVQEDGAPLIVFEQA